MTGARKGNAPAGKARGAVQTGLAADQRLDPSTDFVQTRVRTARQVHAPRGSE